MLQSVLLLGAFVASVAAHGQPNKVVSGGTTMPGPNIYFAGDANNAKTPTRVMYKASGPSYALPTDYTNPNVMSCEGSANVGAPKTLSVAAGSSFTMFWQGATGELVGQGGLTAYDPWVHAMGPILDYITPCTNGDCTTFDATNAGWTLLDKSGIDFSQTISSSLKTAMTNKPEPYHPSTGSGLWAMAKLVQDGSTWAINIPSALAPGQYILRHELIAIHNPLGSNPTSGPQHYISCTQLTVTGSGTAKLPAGVKSSTLYDPNGAFAKFDVNSDDPHTFPMPGPAAWNPSGAASSNPASAPAPASSPAASAPKAATSPAQVSAPAPASSPKASPVSSSSSPSSSNAPKCKSKSRRRRDLSSNASADVNLAKHKRFTRARLGSSLLH